MKLQEPNSHEIIEIGEISRMEPSELNHISSGAVTEIATEDPNRREEGNGNPKNIMDSHSNMW